MLDEETLSALEPQRDGTTEEDAQVDFETTSSNRQDSGLPNFESVASGIGKTRRRFSYSIEENL